MSLIGLVIVLARFIDHLGGTQRGSHSNSLSEEVVSLSSISRCVSSLPSTHFWRLAISSLYKCSQISRYHLLLSSKDGRVKRLAEEKLKCFARNKSLKFNPFDYLQKGTIVSTSSQPKTILEMAKRLSRSDDIKARESHTRSLISQGSTLRLQDVNSYAIWS